MTLPEKGPLRLFYSSRRSPFPVQTFYSGARASAWNG